MKPVMITHYSISEEISQWGILGHQKPGFGLNPAKEAKSMQHIQAIDWVESVTTQTVDSTSIKFLSG